MLTFIATRLDAIGARLDTIGAWTHARVGSSPWSNVYGVARTLLALGTLGTLLFNGSALFEPSPGNPTVPHCAGLGTVSLFCHVSTAGLPWARLGCIAVLIVVAIGWRPRWLCVPHWWIAFSVASSIAVEDGGDQVTAVLTLLLVAVALGDPRRWVWSAAIAPRRRHEDTWRLVALGGRALICLQVAVIYFQSATAKLGVAAWQQGTALYYFLNNASVGAPGWIRPLLEPILRDGAGVEALTYGALVIEFGLFLGLFASRRVRTALLVAGFLLHLSIAVLMGLPSFALAMWGALVLYLRAWDEPFPRPAWLDRRRWPVTAGRVARPRRQP
jgi:antimicrobial peptide system SdpB family protein